MNKINKLWEQCAGHAAMEEQFGALISKAFELGRTSSEKTSPFIKDELDRAWKAGKKHRTKLQPRG